MSIADRNIPYVDIRSSDGLLRIKNALDQPAPVRESMFGFPIETLVVDTIDEIQRILIRERLEETKKESMQLQDWGWLGEQMQAIVRGLRNLELNVVLTCHLKETTDAETGKMYFKPQMQGAIGDQLPAFVDLALLLKAQSAVTIVDGEARRTTNRMLQTYPDAQHIWIKDRSGKLPQEIPVDFSTDYKRIAELVFGGIEDLQSTPSVELREPTLVGAAAAPAAAAPAPLPEPTPVITPPSPPLEAVEDPMPLPKPLPTPIPVENPPAPKAEAAVEEKTALTCESCKNTVESQDQADLSRIRFRKILCKPCFSAAKRK